jgi:hemolysin activation/secretion protein
MDDTPIQRFLIDGKSARDPAALQKMFEQIVGRPATEEEVQRLKAALAERAPK